LRGRKAPHPRRALIRAGRHAAATNTLLAVLLLALAACARSDDQAPRNSAVIGIALEPPNLDPTAGAAAAIDEVVYANVFEGLTRIGPDGAVKPALASAWRVSDDGRAYAFQLRDNVVFHDGTSFDANDVKFSLDRARAPGSTNAQRGYFEPIEAVEVVAPDEVIVRLKRPTGAFLFNLGQGDAVVVAPESAASNAVSPVGTGPFRFKTWRRGDSIELERFDGYWGEPAALEAATFRIVSDPSAASAALLAGDIDAFPNFPAVESLPAFQADGRFAVVPGATEGEIILAINNGRKPFDELRVRRAICHAIDRAALIESAMFGYGAPIGSHFPPHHPAYVDLTGVCPFNLARSRALLAEAGLPKGFSARLALPPTGYARRGGEFVAHALGEVGIRVDIVNLEWAQWLERVFAAHDYDMTIVAHTEPMDIDIYARDDYYFQYKDDQFKALYSEFAASIAEDSRSELLAAMQRKIADDAVNAFLASAPKIGVWNRRLEGLWADSPIQANDLTAVRWADGE
jgi:peptide/nickel transport system substrate-binding protein